MIRGTAADIPRIVLDTNTVLDWLVFADPGIRPVVDALQAGRMRCVACPAMRRELGYMLGHASLARWSPDRPAALAQFDRLADLKPAPAPNSHIGLRCSDADDQVFADLALTEGASWLLTHDRALLKLARRAAAIGLHILRPADWAQRA